MRTFTEARSLSARAAQAFLILANAASEHRVITYGELADGMLYNSANPLGNVLDQLAPWLRFAKLPPLCALAVNKESMLPGSGYHREGADLLADWADVWRFDWRDVIPPTAS
jgi:hypothetical protein